MQLLSLFKSFLSSLFQPLFITFIIRLLGHVKVVVFDGLVVVGHELGLILPELIEAVLCALFGEGESLVAVKGGDGRLVRLVFVFVLDK
jgi:hypothetical protein